MRNPHVFVNPKVPTPSQRYFTPRKQQELLMARRKMLASSSTPLSHAPVRLGPLETMHD